MSNLLQACGSDRLFVEALGMGSMATSFYNTKQTVRRIRAKYLPPELKGIFDPLDMKPFPHIKSSFVRFDLKILSGPCYGRFIGLASKEMLKYLFHAKVWFVDGTFRVVKDPFMQLLVIHVSFSAGNLSRSIPVFFILMTGRKTVNYQKCFETLLRILTDTFPGELGLCKVMMDFEYALWACFRSLMANGTLNSSVKLRGCVFHYAQALFRKVQSLGLTLRYFRDAGVRHIITSFMHLPYLPIDLVAREFDRLSRECTISLVVCEENSALSDFLKYVHNTWIFGSRFQIKDFCQYRSRYRTNNISESYHSQLRKRQFADHMNTLALISRLWQEAEDVPSLMEDFYAGRGSLLALRTSQKEHCLDLQWRFLAAGEITAQVFLKRLTCRPIICEDPEFAEHYSRAHLPDV